jgi:hypothetical protein
MSASLGEGAVAAEQAVQVQIQVDPAPPRIGRIALPPQPPVAQPPQPAQPTTPAPPAPPKPPVDPHIVRLHMADGTIVSGKLSITDLAVDTKFGRLSVPVTKLRYIRPGIESKPKTREKVAAWIVKLGSDSADDRKLAGSDLFAIGPNVRQLLRDALDGAGPRQATELKALIDRLNEHADASAATPADTTTLDVIATTEFTIAGKIVPQSFQLTSDFGTLTMSVEDLVKADRDTGDPAEESRSLAVNEENFVNKTLKSTGLRVDKGDKIIIRASGQLQMSRWGPNVVASPEGASNTGWYQNGKIYNGALIFRIGNGGSIIKAGSALTYTATESGVLHFGIAMNPRFGINDGINYPGEFKVDVKVIKK